MSQSQTTFAHGRYSKRKRAQVNYYSSDCEGEDIEIEQNTQEEYGIPKSKKRRSKETSKKKKEEKPFPFLELPAEIRNIIYGLCLKDPSGINIVATITKRRRTVVRVGGTAVRHYGGGYLFGNPGADSDNPPVTLIPSLLATNKQIHKEARDILYDHEFTMTNPMALHSFMINLGPRAATYIKRMALVGWVAYKRTFKAYNHAGFAMLSWATNLQQLRIDTSMGWNHNGKLAAQQFYRDGFSWLETFGILKGRLDAAVDVVEVGESVFSRGYRNSDPSNRPSHDDMAEDFRKELRKLLNAQRQRILASPAKRVEKSKPEETSEEEQVPPAEGEDGNGNEEESLELDTFSDENQMSEDSDLVMEGFILSNDEENEDENDREEMEIGN